MQDAEFITELAIVLEHGLTNKSDKGLEGIYKQYNTDFPREGDFKTRLHEFVKVLTEDFAPLRNTFLTKSYVCHSLFAALMQRKYGIPGGEALGIPTVGAFFSDLPRTIDNLTRLVEAHELQDTKGPYAEYVEACLSTTHRVKQREARTKWLGNALL